MKKKQIIGIVIFVVLILIIIGIKVFTINKDGSGISDEDLTTVYVATGGGKEDFIADETVINEMRNKYNFNIVYDSWSNGKLIKNP